MRQSRAVELANKILTEAKTIDSFLEKADRPPLSFALQTASELPPITHQAQTAVLEAIDELQALIQGPKGSLMHLTGYNHNARNSIHAILRFGIARAIPVSAEKLSTFDDIASACKLDEQDVKRILRHAMTYRIFAEPKPGFVIHTPQSRLLVEDVDLVSWMSVTLDELPSASRMVDAMERWPRSQEPNHAGFNVANYESDAMFEVLSRDQGRAHRFAESMKCFTKTPSFALSHTVDHWDGWNTAKKVVDIGGSEGHLSIALASTYPHLHCIVQDQDRTITQIAAPPNLHIDFMRHDFMSEQPVKDADVYILRWVLHDWSDVYAAKILRALIPALRPGAWVVINESCLPEVGETSLYQQRFVRATDMTMKQIQNARERGLDDWRLLIGEVHPRFRIDEVIRPPGAALALLIVQWMEETFVAINESSVA